MSSKTLLALISIVEEGLIVAAIPTPELRALADIFVQKSVAKPIALAALTTNIERHTTLFMLILLLSHVEAKKQ